MGMVDCKYYTHAKEIHLGVVEMDGPTFGMKNARGLLWLIWMLPMGAYSWVSGAKLVPGIGALGNFEITVVRGAAPRPACKKYRWPIGLTTRSRLLNFSSEKPHRGTEPNHQE